MGKKAGFGFGYGDLKYAIEVNLENIFFRSESQCNSELLGKDPYEDYEYKTYDGDKYRVRYSNIPVYSFRCKNSFSQ